MKIRFKAFFSATIALLMLLSSIPASALTVVSENAAKLEAAAAVTVPEGYNAHDYNKCVEFLEQTDENGVKNGEKLSGNYDPNDPETWGTYAEWDDESQGYVEYPRFVWIDSDGAKRIQSIQVCCREQCGVLDVADCTALEYLNCYVNDITEFNLSGCIALKYLSCDNTAITELDVSDCTSLYSLWCNDCNLTELDVSGSTSLYELSCIGCNLTSLDVSDCCELGVLVCWDNRLTEINLNNTPKLPYDHLRAEGNGFVAYEGSDTGSVGSVECKDGLSAALIAVPQEGASFEGFYDENGTLISEGECNEDGEYIYSVDVPVSGSVIARFSGGFIAGDVDGDGSVTAIDALIAMRLAINTIDGSSVNADAADMDGNGSITISDVALILRASMGLPAHA